VGGYVTAAWGWQSVFFILLGMGVAILLAVFFWLPASYTPDRSISLKPEPILRNFWQVLREPQFYTYAFTGAIAFSGLFAYVSGSPILFMDVFHTNEKEYGWIFAFLSVGFIGSSQINTLLLRQYRSEQIVYVALIGQFLIALTFLAVSINGWLTLPITLAFLFVFLCCIGFTNPNAAALSLAPFTRNGGSASALMGALQMGMGTLISVIMSLFEVPSAIPMVMAMAGSSGIALLVLLTGRKQITAPIEIQAEAEASLLH
jgi:DHA1 family bicyclomycin/chloramphenicol resistance-like MFS transporter